MVVWNSRALAILVTFTMLSGCATGLTEFRMSDGAVVLGEALKVEGTTIHIRPDMSELSGKERRKKKNRNRVVELQRDAIAEINYDQISQGARISTITGAVLIGAGVALIVWGANGGEIEGFIGGVLGGGVTLVGAPMLLFGGISWARGSSLESSQRDILEGKSKGIGLFEQPDLPQSYRLTLRF